MQFENVQGKQAAPVSKQMLGRDFAWMLLAILLLFASILVPLYISLPAPADPIADVLQLLLGLAYVLFMPGYSLTAALFPASDDLDGIERSGLSLGLSIAWITVLALILDQLQWGLFFWPILIGELLSMLLFMTIALIRRARLPAGQAYAPAARLQPRSAWRAQPDLNKRIYMLAVISLLAAGLAAAWVFLVPADDAFMTEFYILGKEGLAEDYPREAAAGQELTVTMGIANRERQPQTYTVEVWVVDPWEDKRELVNTVAPITLSPGETVEQSLIWSMPWSGDDQIVDFYLLTDGVADGPYRALRLWLNVLESENGSDTSGGFTVVAP